MSKRKPKKKPSFEALQAMWDEKLRASGFEDIEDRRTGLLKAWSGKGAPNPYGNIQKKGGGRYTSLVWKISQADYYRFAGHFLHAGKFKNKEHRNIWRLHCEGLSLSAIAKKLGLTQRQARYTVSLIQKEFGLSRLNNKEATNTGSDLAAPPNKEFHPNQRR